MIYEGVNGSGGSLTGVENPRDQAYKEYVNSRLEYRGVKDQEEEQMSTKTDIYDEIKKDLYGNLDLENEEMPNDNNYYDSTMKRYTDYQNQIDQDQKEQLMSNVLKIGALIGAGYLLMKFI